MPVLQHQMSHVGRRPYSKSGPEPARQAWPPNRQDRLRAAKIRGHASRRPFFVGGPKCGSVTAVLAVSRRQARWCGEFIGETVVTAQQAGPGIPAALLALRALEQHREPGAWLLALSAGPFGCRAAGCRSSQPVQRAQRRRYLLGFFDEPVSPVISAQMVLMICRDSRRLALSLQRSWSSCSCRPVSCIVR
jgi:hypothetical protein